MAAGVLPCGTARVRIKHLCWSLLGAPSVQVVLLGVFKPRQIKKKHPFLLTSPVCSEEPLLLPSLARPDAEIPHARSFPPPILEMAGLELHGAADWHP